MKATIEAGGWEVLSKASGWVRGLLNILKKPNPPATTRMCIVVLTRTFQLTWQYPTLIREITTPALPSFIGDCINLLEKKNGKSDQQDVDVVFNSFVTLLPRHPTAFRAFQERLVKLSQVILYSSPFHPDSSIISPICHLLALVPQCEPRQGSGEKWKRDLEEAVQECHIELDQILAFVVEDWQSTSAARSGERNHKASQQSNGSLALHGEVKKQHGHVQDTPVVSCETLLKNLHLVSALINSQTSAVVTTPLGLLHDLLTRLCTTAFSLDASKSPIRFKDGSTKEYRDALSQELPRMHVAAMELLLSLLSRFGLALLPGLEAFLDQIIWVFQIESHDAHVRTSVYLVLVRLLQQLGPSMQREDIDRLSAIIKACCSDIMSSARGDSAEVRNGLDAAGTVNVLSNADAFSKTSGSQITRRTSLPGLRQAACRLLPILLSKIASIKMPPRLRAQIDRTAMLSRNKDALVQSVLNPPSKRSTSSQSCSLLPLLARQFPLDPQTEALLRPRMPIIETKMGDMVSDDEPDDYQDQMMLAEQATDGLEDIIPQQPEEHPADKTPQEEIIDDTATEPDQPTELLPQDTMNPGKLSQEPIDTLRNASSRPEAQIIESAAKRRLENEADPDPKRRRASPVARSLTGSGEADLPGPSLPATDLPRTVVTEDNSTVVTAPATSAPPLKNTVAIPQDDSDDDDENFVIPTLDLHDSSDDEEEGLDDDVNMTVDGAGQG